MACAAPLWQWATSTGTGWINEKPPRWRIQWRYRDREHAALLLPSWLSFLVDKGECPARRRGAFEVDKLIRQLPDRKATKLVVFGEPGDRSESAVHEPSTTSSPRTDGVVQRTDVFNINCWNSLTANRDAGSPQRPPQIYDDGRNVRLWARASRPTARCAVGQTAGWWICSTPLIRSPGGPRLPFLREPDWLREQRVTTSFPDTLDPGW